MVPFISALSLFVLILSNGCFTLPIVDEQFSSSTFSSLNDDLTTEQALSLRLVSDDETSVLPDMDKKYLSDEHMGFQMSTSVNSLLEENASRASRMFDEFSTSEPMTFTTEQSSTDKNEQDDLLFTTIEPITQVNEFERRSFNNEFLNETEVENKQQKIQVDFTTSDTLSFTSTSSSVAPELYTSTWSSVAPKLYTSELSTSTSTQKYIGLLKDEDENENEQVQTTKYMRYQRKQTPKSRVLSAKKSNIQLKDKLEEEDSTETTVPTAFFDQEALNKIANVPNDFMVLDESNDIVVTGLPSNFSTTIMNTTNEAILLNQGEEPSHSEEKESDN